MKFTIGILQALFILTAAASGQNSVSTLRQELQSLHSLQTDTVWKAGSISGFPKKKSQGSAVFYSLLLPGMGELYADDFGTGRYSLVAEVTLWLTYISFQQYGSWLQSDARSFASTHSGASTGGKDDQFFVNVGNFDNVYDYNDKKLRDRNSAAVYDPSTGYYWNWDTDANRQRFRLLRISSDKVYNNSRFVIGAVIVNHIVSALNAARLVRHYNRNIDENMGSLQVEPNLLLGLGRVDGMRVTYVQHF